MNSTRVWPRCVRSALASAGQGFGGRGGGGATWAADGKSFEFENAGKRLRFDVDTKKVTDASRRRTAAGRPRAGVVAAVSRSADGSLISRSRRRATIGRATRIAIFGLAIRRAATQCRSRPTAAPRRASSTALPAGSTAKSYRNAPRCGGRPMDRSSRSTASTRARCPISTSRRT